MPQITVSLYQLCLITQFGQIPGRLSKKCGGGEGISSVDPERCCLISSDWLADVMNGVFMLHIQAVKHAHRDDRKCPMSAFVSPKPAVCVCLSRPNCVQVLSRWFQMTQKKPACFLVVPEECGNDVERRATSPSIYVYTDIYRSLFSGFDGWRVNWDCGNVSLQQYPLFMVINTSLLHQ